MKIRYLFVVALLIIGLSPITANAHSGGTDENGCHWCWTDECYGEYHCHNSKTPTTSYSSSSVTYKSSSNEDSEDYKQLFETYRSMYRNEVKKQISASAEATKYKRLFENYEAYLNSVLLFGPVAFIWLALFKRKQIKSLKEENERLTNRDNYNKNEIAKLKKEIQDIDTERNKYKHLSVKIAKQYIDDWFAERYKGRPNPYTGKPITSEKDFNEYLEEYQRKHFNSNSD